MQKGKKIAIFPSRFGVFPYLFLLYMLYPIFYLSKETGIKQGIGYSMVTLFLISYRQLYCSGGKKIFSLWLYIEVLLVFLFSFFYDLNYIFLGFFPANFIGWFQKDANFYKGIICLFLAEVIPFFSKSSTLTSTELLYYIPFIIIIIFSPYGIRSMNQRMELEEKLNKANQKIDELVKREERVRIARDLHDTLGHTLSLLTLKGQLIQRLVTVDIERAKAEAREMELTSRAALRQVRELVSDMRAVTITEELLQIQHILKSANISYEYNSMIDFSEIPSFTQNIISLCIREAVTNIVKHSKATKCTIFIKKLAEKMEIFIQDNGVGIPNLNQFGNGLRGMEERLALIDGELRLSASDGTMLKITVPIIKTAERKDFVI